MLKTTLRCVTLLLLVAMMTGCAAQKAYRQAEKDGRRHNWDKAIMGYSKALALDPGNTRFGVALERAKLKSSASHFEKGKQYAASGQWQLAVAEFQQTLLLHPGNQHAANELDRAMRMLNRETAGTSDIERLKEKAKRDAMGPPRLDPRSNIPILLEFPDVEVGKIFEAISKASQINFIYDEKTDLTQELNIDIGSVSLEKAMDILMLQTKNFYMVIDEHTILIAPDTRPKRQEYESQVIRTFFLSNGETKQVVTLLRSLLQSRQIAENPDLNSVTIKDTPDKVAIAERIIEANDKAKGEVLIDVELLEINRTVVKNLGIDLSSKALSLVFKQTSEGGTFIPINNLDTLKRKGSWSIGPVPSVIINFLKSDSETKSIAKPQLRVTEGEKAEILIGDRVPIPSTSFSSQQTYAGNIVPMTSFTYQNVGITVQIEPRVHHNKEVTLKVQVEVSQLAGSVDSGSGLSQPIIGTRQIQTVIRLRDGETNVLAGLIKRDDEDTQSGVPGLMDLPGINRLFGNTSTNVKETDIIMTLTPQIIRMPDITEEDLATLWVGTEENMKLRGPNRGVFGVTAFGNGEPGGEVMEPPVVDSRTGGTVNRMAPSEEEPAEEDLPEAEEEATPDPGERREDETADETGVEEEPEEDLPVGPAAVQLIPSRTSYRVGEMVEIQVVISNASNVSHVPFHLRFNREVLEFVQPAMEGDFLRSDGGNTMFIANPSSAGNEVVVGNSRLGGDTGASGGGVLATFQFLALNPGPCGFAFTGASLSDPQRRNLPASFMAADVEVIE